jgi:hypothetical protein
MTDNKGIKLSLRSANGRIVKNEFYYFNQMKEKQLKLNKKYFSNFFFGKLRRKCLDVFLKTMSDMIDMDNEGKSVIKK